MPDHKKNDFQQMQTDLLNREHLPKRPELSKDAVAALLKTTPEALEEFERAYKVRALAFDEENDNLFEVNSRQATERYVATPDGGNCDVQGLDKLRRRIVDELLALTPVYVYDGKKAESRIFPALPEHTPEVKIEDIEQIPLQWRPQLSGNLAKVDIESESYPHLLGLYDTYLHSKDRNMSKLAYNLFRQGLDILDLDPVTYEMIGMNPNSMGHWLPQLVKACEHQDFFKIPATTIAIIPLTLLQLTRVDYPELTRTTLDIVDQWAYEAFSLDDSREYFIKTGTYSSKFDFRNAYVHGAKEVRELGEYLLFIHFQALQMASPLTHPCVYGVSTTNEWVVREFIHDKENNPCIYKGLPLHTEYRVFVDCDRNKVIGCSPYWEPETMKKRFGHGTDANSPHQIHDYIIYSAHEDTLMRRYKENKDAILHNIRKILPYLNLGGQWSIDVMQNGDEFWIIDMALAESSAFYNCVPKRLRASSEENWIPVLPENTKK